MVMKGETILTGALVYCDRCKTEPKWGIYKSGAGWYVGTFCNCGPYSRESQYYPTKEAVEENYSNLLWRKND